MSTSTVAARPTVAVFKFSSCDGCQLSLLDCEDELLGVVGAVQISEFKELDALRRGGALRRVLCRRIDHDSGRRGTHSGDTPGVVSARDHRRLRHLRRDPALRNYADVGEFTTAVYAHPEYINTLAQSTGIADHVPVDFELRDARSIAISFSK